MLKIYESQRSVWEGGRNTKKLTKQKWRLESDGVLRFTHFKGDLSAEKRIEDLRPQLSQKRKSPSA